MAATLDALTPWKDRAGAFSALRLAVFVALLLPGLRLVQLAVAQELGPEPLRTAMHESGVYAIRILLISLCVTPLRQLLRWGRLAELRRMVGLFALAYAVLHLVLYVAYQNWRVWFSLTEIVLRFYLTIGFLGLLVLVALGVTSTDGWVRRLGREGWRRLHQGVMMAGVLGLWHFMLHTKSDITEPVLTAGLFVWLWLYRVVAPEGAAPGLWRLLGVTAAAGLATALGETAWYALKTGVNAWMVLEANLDVEFGLRPALWVGLAGLGATAMREIARFVPRNGRAKRVLAPRVDGGLADR